MIATYEADTDRLISAKSDDDLIEATQVPMTNTYGSYRLVDLTTGRPVALGEYEDYSRPMAQGTLTGEKVPAHIWASALELMREADAVIAARVLRIESEALVAQDKRYSATGERLAADMDRANSKN